MDTYVTCDDDDLFEEVEGMLSHGVWGTVRENADVSDVLGKKKKNSITEYVLSLALFNPQVVKKTNQVFAQCFPVIAAIRLGG